VKLLQQSGIAAKAQIVIAAEIQILPAVNLDQSSGKRPHRHEPAPQVPAVKVMELAAETAGE
jgi:hypothetical protein